ncbi:MAG: asparagine synthase-related protein [Bacteroidales bacterium]|jgi:asparagine synthase (glutamine-hydrolysing)|nr:asparagine synthase-related protein [Bacteroidales bacterium]
MSVIFGLFYREGKPVSDELEFMYRGMMHFPHEKYAFAIHGNCGLGHMLTYNTPEAVYETMPKWIEKEKLLFVAEGRIDNRDELFGLLDVPASEQAKIPDGDLILKAYRKWGEKCIDKLVGKWSLSAFHTDIQKLFITRDKWDYTSIDYYIDDKVFAFSTSSKGLFQLPFIKKEIDELMIARMLVVWPGGADKTFFKGIKRLLPSHALRVTREHSGLYRYWNYANIKVREGLKLEDYVEDLFENLNKAVKSRLRSYKPVAATLSGGMDSSTVCVLAADYLKNEGKHLRTYSHIPEFLPSNSLLNNIIGNEKPFIDAIVKSSGNIDPIFLDSAKISPIEGIKEFIRLFGEPSHAAGNAYWLVDIYKTAVLEGYGSMLIGEFGNATISRTGIEEALPARELLRRYGMKSLIKKRILKPLLYGNTFVADIYKRIAFGSQPWREIAYSSEAFEKSLGLAEKIKRSGFDPTFKRYFKDPNCKAVLMLELNALRLLYGAYLGCETGLELRDPTGDPRVIESALSIPNEMYLGEMNKWVLRTMMKDKLPDVVRLNTKKGKQSSDLTARLCAYPDEMNNILSEMDNSDFGRIADMKRIRAEWQKMQSDSTNYPLNNVFHVLRPVAVYMMWRRCLQ